VGAEFLCCSLLRSSWREKTQLLRPGFASTRYFRPASQYEPGPPLAEHPFEGLPEDPFGEEATEEAREKEGAAAEHNLPEDPFGEPTDADDEGAIPASIPSFHELHVPCKFLHLIRWVLLECC
jgi:hypothetical protein